MRESPVPLEAAAEAMNALGTDWMRQLAAHYESVRDRNPADRLMIVFDIDGTILDIRYPILRLLRAYDRAHGTCVFRRLCLAEIRDHDSHIEDLLYRLEVPRSLWDGIRERTPSPHVQSL